MLTTEETFMKNQFIRACLVCACCCVCQPTAQNHAEHEPWILSNNSALLLGNLPVNRVASSAAPYRYDGWLAKGEPLTLLIDLGTDQVITANLI
jgi:hypothetical protein